MNVSLYVNTNRIRFSGTIGWYKGEPFYLLKVALFEINPEIQYITLFHLQMALFVVSLGVEWQA